MVKYLDNNSGFRQWSANKDSATKKSKLGGFLWWFILFLASWWLLSFWMTPKPTETQAVEEKTIIEDLSAVPVSEIKTEDIAANVQGLRIYDVKLLKFAKNGSDTDAGVPVSLLSGEGAFAEVGFLAPGTTTPVSTTVWKKDGDAFVWNNSNGIEYRRTITVDGYVITIEDAIKNASGKEISVAPYARIVRANDMPSSAGVYTGAIAYANSDIEHDDWHSLDKKAFAYSTTSGFVGFTDQYWETIVSVDSLDQTLRIKKVGNLYHADAAANPVSIAAGETKTLTTNLFVGPREQNVLDMANNKIAGIDETVDYGWFWFLARPMLWALNALNSIVMNYGVAIIILTILLRLAMWPLTRKSYVSMMAMQKMQPELARIQKLYENDKVRLQMEMMKLYQTHKTSPMSGCLPMLIQIPIFFALYKALLVSVQMRSAHFLWISDLAAMDPYFILPILMGLTMWLQQNLQTASNSNTGNTNDAVAQTQKVMKWMPLIFTVRFAWMPAGLVLYWTISNVFGIGQMFYIKKKMVK